MGVPFPATDRDLLQAYADRRSPDAFAELVRRYAGMVFGVGLRVTGSREDAQDVAQECFLQLATQAARVHGPLGAWLHTLARTRSVDRVRRQAARRRHERQAAVDAVEASPTAPEFMSLEDWVPLSRQIDAAIDALPDDLRGPLVEVYLHGQTQHAVAQRLGLSQGTVSRRIEKAVDLLRQDLQRSGVGLPAAGFHAVLGGLAAPPVPPTLQASLTKIGLAGTGATTAATAGFAWSGYVAAALLAVVVAGAIVLSGLRKEQVPMSPQPAAVAVLPIHFRGNIYRQDSFTLAMQTAARHLGIDVPYEELLALSGNAFAPALRPSEPCRTFWAIQGGGRNIDLVCRRLGMTCRPFPEPKYLGQTISPKPAGTDDSPAVRQWAFDNYKKPVIAAINDTIARGELIVSMGEFMGRPEGVWTEWGVVTGASEDGTLYGAASNGRSDNRIDHVRDGWFIGLDPAGPTITAEQADREILRRAAMRIRGDVTVKTETYGRGIVFGAPAMDDWIRTALADDFCPDCTDDAPCAARIAQPTFAGAEAAAAWLASHNAAEAAGQYRAIAALLRPYSDRGSPDSSGDGAVSLGLVSYDVRPLTPSLVRDGLPPGAPGGLYPDHLNAVYNIHCELATDSPDELNRRTAASGFSWEQFWAGLPATRLGDRPFGLMAMSDDAVAGYIRFYPADRASLRSLSDRQARTPDTLLIGGCAFTADALDSGLDKPLLDRVVEQARRDGYARIQAIAWPDVRAYAAWGEGIRQSTYANAGFKQIAHAGGDARALADQLGGAHGQLVQASARQDVPASTELPALAQLELVELDLQPGQSVVAGYTAVLASPQARQNHATTVLEPVKAALLAAAVALEQGLAAAVDAGPPAAEPVHDGDRTYLPGAEAIEWGNITDQQNSVIAAATAAMKVMGHNVSFEQMMGWGGSAFRVQIIDGPGISPSSPFALCGRDDLSPAVAAMGYTVEWIHTTDHQGKPNPETADKAAAAVRASIDAGLPALGTSEECGLIVGYTAGGQWIWRAYSPKGPGYVDRADWPWSVGILRRVGEPMTPEQRLDHALREAIAMSAAPIVESGRQFSGDPNAKLWRYFGGFAAYEEWAKRLWSGTLTDAFGNGYAWGTLSTARQMAARYLREAAASATDAQKPHLLAAADVYDQINQHMNAERPDLPKAWFLMPWDLKSGWTPEHQMAQARVIGEIVAMEHEAIRHLEQAAEAK